MPPVSDNLAIFPLGVVLFPGSRIELHIFEERYKTMIKQCIDDGLKFGVVLYDNNQLHSVGCEAVVIRITQQYPDGSFDILAEGDRKFKLLDISQSDIGYLRGITEPCIEDETADVPQSVILRSLALYNAMLDIVYPGAHDPLMFNEKSGHLSYLLAEKSGLELSDRQRLLELSSETLRLEMIAQHIEASIPRLKEHSEIKRIVANDGYLPRLKRS